MNFFNNGTATLGSFI